uniref:Uncharacterized protein n=1 Tax=Molossus molossus TaxID=27622 RepID=A0A7J8CRQ0_MOLMO|nr:hypothetical protein HJG59_009743 [Molossus molossus]
MRRPRSLCPGLGEQGLARPPAITSQCPPAGRPEVLEGQEEALLWKKVLPAAPCCSQLLPAAPCCSLLLPAGFAKLQGGRGSLSLLPLPLHSRMGWWPLSGKRVFAFLLPILPSPARPALGPQVLPHSPYLPGI